VHTRTRESRERSTCGRTEDGEDDDGDGGGDGANGAGEEEVGDGADEVDRGGDGHREQQLQADDRVHLADEGPPKLRALHHVRVHAAVGPRRVARLDVVAALAVLAHGWLPAPAAAGRLTIGWSLSPARACPPS